MNFNSSGYFAYKKNKIQNEIEAPRRPISRFSFSMQLFGATFVVIFIVSVIAFMKFSSKMDIEYAKGELQLSNGTINTIPNYNTISSDEEPQRKIDTRLLQIQQEENAPSEARIIEKQANNQEVIASSHIENNKKIEKMEKQKKAESQEEQKNNSKISTIINEVKLQNKVPTEQIEQESNVTIMSKVLIGRYNTFEEAQKLVGQIKAKNSKLQPFAKKIGNVFSVQMGSYQDFATARSHAQSLKNQGFDVWIYQQ